MDFELITAQAPLEALLGEAHGTAAIALDTEFERIRTYHPRLCLVQLAFDDRVVCVDGLAELDLTPLWRFLADSEATKVMHAGRQDLELIFAESRRMLGQPAMPAPFADTQIAAGLLGIGEQISYAALARAVLDVDLAKEQTRTDWTRRPLDADQLAYAADDVRYLLPLWHRLQGRLEESARRSWVDEDSAALLDHSLYEVDTAGAWRRVKGAGRLPAHQRALLQRLATWRETQALARDKPRQWIARDDVLLALARTPPRDVAALRRRQDVPAPIARRYGEALVTLLERPVAPEDSATGATSVTPPDETLVRALLKELRARATQANVCPTAIASRKEVEQFAREARETRLDRGWRRAFVGEALAAIRDAYQPQQRPG